MVVLPLYDLIGIVFSQVFGLPKSSQLVLVVMLLKS
uniref:Uncharacterized protein n=1 Tax=Rhizophora mucronata TaxID=61149 RepID=A0A2P2Q6N4_RHIMU